MKRFLVALLLSSCASVAPDPSFHVMTYNIRLNLASDGPNAWPHRKDAVAALLSRADLAGVQEAPPEQLSDLDALLPGFDRFGVGRNAARSGEHSAIFYRTDRFELLDHDTFWLSETPRIAGSKGWDAAYERIVTWGRLRDRRTGRTFFHFNTHFDHVGKIARRESGRLLTSRVDRIASRAPVIVTGDFNDVAPELGAGLRDTRTTRYEGPDSTWNGFQAIEPGRRIDFIFVGGPIEVLTHTTIADTLPDGRFPSDHLPVMAEVRVGDD